MNIAIKCICISIFSFFFHSAQSQQKIEYSIGMSLNYTDPIEMDNGEVYDFIGNDNTVDPGMGFGLHIRALSNFSLPVNYSFGPSFKFRSVNEFSTVTASDVELNLPLLAHIKLPKGLEIQAGASYDLLINRTKLIGERKINATNNTDNRHYITPTLGLAYLLKNHIEFNLSYHYSLQQKDRLYIADLEGNTVGNIDYNDQYLQFAVFFRNMGKFKKIKTAKT